MHFSILGTKIRGTPSITRVKKPAEIRGQEVKGFLFFRRGDFGISHDGIDRALDGGF